MNARNAIRVVGVSIVGFSAAGGVAAGLAASRHPSHHVTASNLARDRRLVDASDAERAALLARLGSVETLAAALPPLAHYHAVSVSRWSPPKPRVVVLPPRVQVVYAPSAPSAPTVVVHAARPVSQAKPVTSASPSGNSDDNKSSSGGDG